MTFADRQRISYRRDHCDRIGIYRLAVFARDLTTAAIDLALRRDVKSSEKGGQKAAGR